MNELINKDNEWIIHFLGNLDRLLDNVEHLTANYRPTLDGERFFTDIQLGGKILYRESDIERMLADSYRTAYRQAAT